MSEYLIFKIIIAINFVVALGSFLTLLFISAPYGRHARRGWGPLMPNWLGWFLMESVSVIVFPIMFMIGSVPPNSATLTFLIMWEVHYLQRSFIYPFVMRDGQKMMPLAIPLLAAGFNLSNGYINGRYLFHFSGSRYNTDWLLDQRFIIGIGFFISGFCINLWADHKLRELRQPGETSYKIPYDGLYRYISCPNYFGEILEWIGWAVATWSLPGLAFAIWTFANLAPRAQANHKWYHEHFQEYPGERKALIPRVW